MRAKRIFQNPFPDMETLDREWTKLAVKEVKLVEAFGNDAKVEGLFNWIAAHCEGCYYISSWIRFYRQDTGGQIEMYFEHAPSAFNAKITWG